jgi:hypothetical protein
VVKVSHLSNPKFSTQIDKSAGDDVSNSLLGLHAEITCVAIFGIFERINKNKKVLQEKVSFCILAPGAVRFLGSSVPFSTHLNSP